MIRKITDKDFCEVQRLLKEHFHGMGEVKDPFTRYFLYEEETIVGLISFSNLYDHYDLNYIWVDEKHRQKKIASALMEKMIDEARKEKIKIVTLEVSEKNKIAIHLYEKYGFTKKAIRKNYYKEENGILMTVEIR